MTYEKGGVRRKLAGSEFGAALQMTTRRTVRSFRHELLALLILRILPT